jgi:DNA-binding NarL/FixJ family response regulator
MNIILIDDHTLFRESLRRMIEGNAGWAVFGDYGTAAAAFAAVENGLTFDLALIDYELDETNPRGNNGLIAATQLRCLRPGIPILMVTAGMGGRDLLRAVQEAKVGIFLKNEPSEELFLAMRRSARGELWVSSAVALSLLEHTGTSPTSPEQPFSVRERTVLRLVLEGLTNKEIAAQINISESLVKATLQKLFEKAGVRSRSQLVRFAIEFQPDLNLE